MKQKPITNTFTITRSFSKKVQAKQYEPIESFCSVSQTFESLPTDDELEGVARQLDDFCIKEVEHTIKDLMSSAAREVTGEEAPF